MNRSLPEAQAYIDALYQNRAEHMAYMQGVFDMIKPDISITAHGPSAEDTAAYHNALYKNLKGTLEGIQATATALTVAWLQSQIAAAASPDSLRPRKADPLWQKHLVEDD